MYKNKKSNYYSGNSNGYLYQCFAANTQKNPCL